MNEEQSGASPRSAQQGEEESLVGGREGTPKGRVIQGAVITVAPKDIPRFWKKVEKTDSCWNWIGAKTPRGYGTFRFKFRWRLAHRVSFAIAYGECPIDMPVCRSCGNPSCVNPQHFFLHEHPLNVRDPLPEGDFDGFKLANWASVSVKASVYINHHIEKSPNGCWLWTGLLSTSGYGIAVCGKENFPAHRLSFHVYNGDLQKGLFICHRCDTPACVNPEHLFQGTPKDNTLDAKKKFRLGKLTREQLDLVKKLLSEGKMTQSDIAKLVGLKKSAITRWNAVFNNPTARWLQSSSKKGPI